MQIAVIDDLKTDRTDLSEMIERYCTLRNIQADTTQFESGESFLNVFEVGKYQIVFLDIYMNGMNGMETAEKIFKIDKECRLVFCTTSFTHAVDSYGVFAKYYLTKPLMWRQFKDAMDICCKDITDSMTYITVGFEATRINLLLSDIFYIDCTTKRVCIHLANRDIIVSDTFSEIIAAIEGEERFMICNRNVIVNMDHIFSVMKDTFLMKNDVKVPIRVHGKGAIKKDFLLYSTKGLREKVEK